MINRVVLVGRMTRDPELRRTGNGTPVTSFTLALDRGFSTQDGQSADFIPCQVWNRVAETTAQYCHKGSLVGVEGSLRSRRYTDRQGNNRTAIEVNCDRVQFLETRNQAGNGAGASQNNYTNNSYNNQSGYNQNSGYSQNNGYGNNSYGNQGGYSQNNGYETQTVDIDNEFSDDASNFDITADDLQF